jgi:hypothetical protein
MDGVILVDAVIRHNTTHTHIGWLLQEVEEILSMRTVLARAKRHPNK